MHKTTYLKFSCSIKQNQLIHLALETMILLNFSTLLFLFLIHVKSSVPNFYYPTELAFHWGTPLRHQPIPPFEYHHQLNPGVIPFYWQPYIPMGTLNQQWDNKFPEHQGIKTVLSRIVGGVPAKKGDYPFIVYDIFYFFKNVYRFI